MGSRAMVLGGLLAATLLAGCGGSSHKTTSSSVPSTSSSAAAPATTTPTADPALMRRLLTKTEMPPGFAAQGSPSVSSTIAEWLQGTQTSPDQVKSETARYKRIGFVDAATLNLNSSQGAGISLVEQFRSPAGARAELANSVATFVDQSPVKFSVRAIPGSVGFGGVGTGQGVNVAFATGDYYYLIGEQPDAASNRAGVTASAEKLYHRVRG